MKTPQLLDRFGAPVKRAELRSEIAGATVGGTRSPITGTPADGLNPQKLAAILREAEMGNPLRYLELAEYIEERDLHYLGVLGTRRRSVTQIPITVKAASEKPEDEARADMVRSWLDRGELADEMFDVLDTIGKGYSLTEIIWDNSEGDWQPARLEYRDPRWFRFDRTSLTTPMLIGENGEELPLPAFKFIYARIKAKSGLPVRGGLARAAAWAYLFKKFTERDWAIFCQTYGHPVRVGKYGSTATEAEKRTLLRAVQNIAGDMAGIIPESMLIEFISAQNTGAAHAMYLARAEYLDKQVSKAVLGQTATTDAEVGGLGSGKEHRQVQKDIETADATALAAVLNRDLIIPWMKLQFGEGLRTFPRLIIAQPEQEDLVAFSSSIGEMIDRGLQVAQEDVLSKFGLPTPKDGSKLMTPSGGGGGAPVAMPSMAPIKRETGVFKRQGEPAGMVAALQASTAPQGEIPAPSPDQVLADKLGSDAEDKMGAVVGQLEAMLGTATTLEEFRLMIREAFGLVDTTALAEVMGQAMVAAFGAGASASAEDGADGTV